MPRPPITLDLIGPSGDRERWTIRFARMKRGDYGHTDWVKRIVTVNHRLRSPLSIAATLHHENTHVSAGQNGSEELAVNSERNFIHLLTALGLEVVERK